MLENAAGVEAVVAGKPAPAFFAAGLERLGVDAERAAMVGDDLRFDVLAAMDQGLTGIQVRTGKYREDAYRASERKADHCVADLAEAVTRILEPR